MKPYGMKKHDRVVCPVKECGCGDRSSKHPVERSGYHNKNRRLKKAERQEWSVLLKQKYCN